MDKIFNDRLSKLGIFAPPLAGRDDQEWLLLDFNERTIPLPLKIRELLMDAPCFGRTFNRYPNVEELQGKLADYAEVNQDNIVLTNGSDAALEFILRATTTYGDEAIIPHPSFGVMKHLAEVVGVAVKSPLIDKEKGFPTDEVIKALSHKTRFIFLCNPNNPTGNTIPLADILRIAKEASNAAILVDECYFEFLGESAAPFINQYPNLFVTRTLSKTWGLAGLRLGYIISRADNIMQLRKIISPFSVNQMSLHAGLTVLENRDYMLDYCRDIKTKSIPFVREFLTELKIPFWPLNANFVLVDRLNVDIFTELHHFNIKTRPRKDHPIDGSTRITIGTVQQMSYLQEALTAIMQK